MPGPQVVEVSLNNLLAPLAQLGPLSAHRLLICDGVSAFVPSVDHLPIGLLEGSRIVLAALVQFLGLQLLHFPFGCFCLSAPLGLALRLKGTLTRLYHLLGTQMDRHVFFIF
jgi:hypothetical protein